MKIIAHRGASQEYPENSIPAFDRAVEIGVDAIEVDLLVTKDDQIIARHDDLIQKDGSWYYLHELTFHEIQEIDIGQGERIPSLDRLFERFHRHIPMVFDLKRFGLAERLCNFLSAHKTLVGIHVTSFIHSEIVTIGRLCPTVERSIALASIPIRFEGLLEDADTRQVSLFRGYLEESIIHRLHEQNIRVWVYPVNLRREADCFAAWGVDAIFTDDPGTLMTSLGPQ